MKCLILAAGYATRLYPLTENFPKPLLKVGGKAILDWLVDDIDSFGEADEFVVISNSKFFSHFKNWADAKPQKITVLDDGTSTNETRLGAVRDIQFAIDKLSLDDDLFVIAGDNVLEFSLTRFLDFAKQKGTSCTMRYCEPDTEKLKKAGIAEVSSDGRILSFEEKPEKPKSHWCTPPFYYYKKDDAKLVRQAISDGCPVDAPGSFIAYLCKKAPVYSMEMPGRRFDIGNLEGYNKINSEYKGITK